MGSHPINLAVRFLLELSALLTMGIWGWQQSESWPRLVLALGIPLLAAGIWGTFAVPEDPSRSGKAPIAIPGMLRLMIELTVFGFAVWAINNLGNAILSWIMLIVVLLHYIVSYDRIMWLIKQ